MEGIELTVEQLRVATEAADPTDAWLINEDGTTFLDPADDISRFCIQGYWPRYLMRAGSASRTVYECGGEEEAVAHLNGIIRQNL